MGARDARDLNSGFHACEAGRHFTHWAVSQTLCSLFFCLVAFLCPRSFTLRHLQLLSSLASAGRSMDSCALGVGVRAWPVCVCGGGHCQFCS